MQPEEGRDDLVQPAAVQLALLNPPQLRRDLWIVAAHLLDEPLGILQADEHLERVTERKGGREGVVDDGVDDQASPMRSGANSSIAATKPWRKVSAVRATIECENSPDSFHW